jgi:ATP-dependent DNA helicase RecQ
MVDYCKTDKCLRAHILNYFGEQYSDSCGNCANCVDNKFETVDITKAAGVILKCMRHLPRQYGISVITDVLHGGKDKKIVDGNLTLVAEYGAMKAYSKREIAAIINKMLDTGIILKVGEEYPVLCINDSADGERVKLTMSVRKRKAVAQKRKEERCDELFNLLKGVRYSIAQRDKVPSYIIFSDATIADMCMKMPTTEEEFLNISGVGEVKCQRYAADFLNVINSYLSNHI